MRKHKSEKTTTIVRRLEAMQRLGNETLDQVAEVIKRKVEFYDDCLASWDRAAKKFSMEEIELGRQCCHAGLNMAESIVNGLRILYLKEEER